MSMTFKNTVALLEEVRAFMEQEDGIGAEDQLSLYLAPLMDKAEEYGMDEDALVEAIVMYVEMLVEDGLLMPMPDEDSDEDYIAQWIGTAKTMGLIALIENALDDMVEMADDEFEDDSSEEGYDEE